MGLIHTYVSHVRKVAPLSEHAPIFVERDTKAGGCLPHATSVIVHCRLYSQYFPANTNYTLQKTYMEPLDSNYMRFVASSIGVKPGRKYQVSRELSKNSPKTANVQFKSS